MHGDTRAVRGAPRGRRRCGAPVGARVPAPLRLLGTLRYARASGIAPAAFIGFSPFPPPPPPLAQLASWPGRKSLRARAPVPLRPPSGLGLPGRRGRRRRAAPSAGSRHPIFLVSVAVGSSGATPPPPPRRPVSPAAIKAEWGGLRQRSRAPSGRAGALLPRPPFWGPGAGLFCFRCGGYRYSACADARRYILWCFTGNIFQYKRSGT